MCLGLHFRLTFSCYVLLPKPYTLSLGALTPEPKPQAQSLNVSFVLEHILEAGTAILGFKGLPRQAQKTHDPFKPRESLAQYYATSRKPVRNFSQRRHGS